MRKVKLKKGVGNFADPITHFRLRAGEVKALPPFKALGPKTQEWLNGGGLVIVENGTEFEDEPAARPPASEPSDEGEPGVDPASRELSEDDLVEMHTIEQLREMCDDLEIEYSKHHNQRSLARKILEVS